MHVVKLEQTSEDTNKIKLSNIKCIIAYLNQYTHRKKGSMGSGFIYCTIFRFSKTSRYFFIYIHFSLSLSFGFYLFCIYLDFPLLLLSLSHKQRIGWKIHPAKTSFRNLYFRIPLESLYQSVINGDMRYLLSWRTTNMHPPPCFEDHKKLKMES